MCLLKPTSKAFSSVLLELFLIRVIVFQWRLLCFMINQSYLAPEYRRHWGLNWVKIKKSMFRGKIVEMMLTCDLLFALLGTSPGVPCPNRLAVVECTALAHCLAFSCVFFVFVAFCTHICWFLCVFCVWMLSLFACSCCCRFCFMHVLLFVKSFIVWE